MSDQDVWRERKRKKNPKFTQIRRLWPHSYSGVHNSWGVGKLAPSTNPFFWTSWLTGFSWNRHFSGRTLGRPVLAVLRNPSSVSLLRLQVLLPNRRDQITSPGRNPAVSTVIRKASRAKACAKAALLHPLVCFSLVYKAKLLCFFASITLPTCVLVIRISNILYW